MSLPPADATMAIESPSCQGVVSIVERGSPLLRPVVVSSMTGMFPAVQPIRPRVTVIAVRCNVFIVFMTSAEGMAGLSVGSGRSVLCIRERLGEMLSQREPHAHEVATVHRAPRGDRAVVVVSVVVAFGMLPLWALVAAFASRYVPGRWRILRVAWFLFVYLALEALGLIVLFALWIASGFGWKITAPRFVELHYRFMAWFLRRVLGTARTTFRISIDVEPRVRRRRRSVH